MGHSQKTPTRTLYGCAMPWNDHRDGHQSTTCLILSIGRMGGGAVMRWIPYANACLSRNVSHHCSFVELALQAPPLFEVSELDEKCAWLCATPHIVAAQEVDNESGATTES